MLCKICNHNSQILFQERVLQKYNALYFRCEHCGFIQTEQPYWLKEAYNDAITELDLGYVTRNLVYKNIVASIIKKAYNKKGYFLDYGGGYGLFVRFMRDVGFNYFRQEAYCENIFARYFDIKNIEGEIEQFELLTSFEVFEHLEYPLLEFEKMLCFSNSILFSTQLQPTYNITSINDWDYFAPEMGQHISFYTKKSLAIIAEKYSLYFYTNNKDLHLLTKSRMNINWLKYITIKQQSLDKILGRNFCNRKTLIFKDVDYVKRKIKNVY